MVVWLVTWWVWICSMTTAYGVTTGSCIATLLIVTAKVCSSVFCQLKSMQKFAGINWKRVTLTSLKIFTTVWRIVWVSWVTWLMVHMPSQNAGIWVKSTGATRKINSGRRLAIRFTMPMKRQRRSVPLLTVCSTVTAWRIPISTLLVPACHWNCNVKWRKNFLVLKMLTMKPKTTRQSMTQKLNMQSGRCCGSVCITPSPCATGSGQWPFRRWKAVITGAIWRLKPNSSKRSPAKRWLRKN